MFHEFDETRQPNTGTEFEENDMRKLILPLIATAALLPLTSAASSSSR